jgi:hypothetical protein
MQLFPPFPFLSAPLAPHRRSVFVVPLSFLTFLFVLYNLQHTGSAFHSFKAIHHTHFCCLLLPFSLPRSFHVRPSAPTRLELTLENRLYIHSFCSSGQPKFYTTRIRTRRTRDIDLREDLWHLHPLPKQSDYSSYRLPLRTIWPPARAELSAQESTQALRKYAGRRADPR